MKKQKNKKLFKIEQFSTGDWICFINSEDKKCIGIINELTIFNKNAETILDQYNSVEVINYIDEDGISGTIKVKDFPVNTLITGVNMMNLFNNHQPNITEKIDLKTFIINYNKDFNLN